MTEPSEVTCAPTQKRTEYFERLIQAHAEEAGQLGIEVVGKVYEDDDVTQIVTSTTAGFLVTSLDRKTDEVEHKWFETEVDPWDGYDGPWPDCDDIGD